MGITTKNGDGGFSSTGNRNRVPKNASVFETLGTVDELNSALGVAKHQVKGELFAIVEALQADLIAFSGELAGYKAFATAEKVAAMEASIDTLMAAAGEFKGFVLPGATPGGAALDLARTVARRAERCLVAQKASGGVTPAALQYLNRMSDLLYALARFADTQKGPAAPDIQTVAGTPKGFMETGQWLCEAVMAEARRMGVKVVCAACDAGGNLVALLRDDGAYIASVDIAINKAYTSASLQMPTENLETLAATDGDLYGIQHTNNGRIVVFAGGVPLVQGGALVGGFGVSGGSAEEDRQLAHFAQNTFENR